MPTSPLTLPAAVLAVAASGTGRAENLAILPSHICQTPSRDELAIASPRNGDANAAARLADGSWSAAYQALIARCQKGDVLVLDPRDAQANSLRYCDFDHPVIYRSPMSDTICVFVGGRREPR